MKNFFLRVVPALAFHFSSAALIAQTEVHTIHQDGVTSARQITFDIQPFEPGDDNRLVVIGLEGLSMGILDEGDIIVLDTGTEQFSFPPLPDGWFRLNVVKRYFSQDIEVSIDGYPAFLAVPDDTLDMFLAQDHLVVAGGMDSGPSIGSLSVRNLDEAPTSILDWGDLSPGNETGPRKSPPSDSTAAASESEEGNDRKTEPGEAAGIPGARDPEKSAARPERSASSRLFTPLF